MKIRFTILVFFIAINSFSQGDLKTIEIGPFHMNLNWTGLSKVDIEMYFRSYDPNNTLKVRDSIIGDTLIYYFVDERIYCRKLTFNQSGFNRSGYCDFDLLVFHNDSLSKSYYEKVLSLKTYSWESVNENRAISKEVYSLDLNRQNNTVFFKYYTLSKRERKILTDSKK